MMRRIAGLLIVSLLLIPMVPPGGFAAEEEKPKIFEVGDKLPDFELAALDGTKVAGKSLQGKGGLTVLAFMTTSCAACMAEMRAISDLKQKYPEKVAFYAVSVDIKGKATVEPYAKTYNFAATYLLDPEFSLPVQFGFTSTPAVVFADRDGKVVYKKAGFRVGRDEDVLIEEGRKYVR